MPKEMLPLLDMPAIHYIVQEALNSDIKNILMITGKGKEAIVNYFDSSPELEALLKERNR